jgi:hypothetical protein
MLKITIKPKIITVNKNLKYIDKKWVNNNYSFNNANGTLLLKGNICNLYTVGPHTISKIANMETALTSAITYGNIKGINKIFAKKTNKPFHFILIILMCIITNNIIFNI